MNKNILKFCFTFSSMRGLAASILIIAILLISSCTKRECRGTIARPFLKLKFKKRYVSNGSTKDTFLHITEIKALRKNNDTAIYNAIPGIKDSFNILSLPLSTLDSTSSYLITWKDTNTKTPTFITEKIKFNYKSYQEQTSELCGFQFYFKFLKVDSFKVSNKNGFQDIIITKQTVNLVNDTVHAYIYLNQK